LVVRRYGFWKEVQNLTLYRNPDPSKGRWTRLVLPADYANKRLAGWNQKHAKDQSYTQFGCNPWGCSDFGDGDAFLYGVGYVEALDSDVVLHPSGDYNSEDVFLWDSWVKSPLCGWSHDKANQKFSFEFYLDNELEEYQPIVIYDDDEAIWAPYQDGSGSFSITLSEETSTVKRGSSSLKAVVGGGSYADVGASATFSPALDWSGKDFLCLWIYGMNSGGVWRVRASDGANWFRWDFSDDFSGWRRVILPLRSPSASSGSLNLAAISSMQVYISAASSGTWYLDRVVVDELRLVRCEVRVPNEIKSVDAYSWDGSQYQRFLEAGLPSSNKLFYLSGLKLSDIRGDGSGLGSTYLGSRAEQVKYQNTLSFDGVDDYVQAPYIELPLPFTVAVWYWFPTATPTHRINPMVDEGFRNSVNWWFMVDRGADLSPNSGIPIFQTRGGGSIANYTFRIYSDTFYHLAVVTNRGIYVNGEFKVAGSVGEFTRGNQPIRIGRSSINEYAVGIVDEVRIYNRALSASEIQQLYQRRFDRTIPDIRSGLVLDMPFDGDALDYSGNNNHGTIYGAKFTAPTSTQLSSRYGCRKRIVFVLGMPPEDYQDSSSAGISQAKIKLEVKYANDGEATYEFEDSDNQYYGLRNISKKYLMLFRKDPQGPVDFIQLKNTQVGDGLPTYLAVKADHNEEIKEVQITLPNLADSSKKHWGQSSKDPTLDEDNDGILDAIEEVENFIDQGGWG